MTIMKGTWLLLAAVCLGASATAEAGATLDAVKRKGYVQCGVSDGLPGFSYADAKGRFKGLDVDICRALAAALFGDAEKVRFTPLSATERFSALPVRHGRSAVAQHLMDQLAGYRAGHPLHRRHLFRRPGLPGQSQARRVQRPRTEGRDGVHQSGTTNELNVADYFRAHGIRYKAVLDDSYEKSARALEAGQCDVLSSDQSQLYAQRLKLAKPEQYVVLPEVISRSRSARPCGRATKPGSTSSAGPCTACSTRRSWGHLEQRRAPGQGQPQPGRRPPARQRGRRRQDLQLPRDWVVQMVRQVGNYGEIFARNVGDGSPLKMPRGLNAQWNLGGLHYAPPIR